MLIDHLVEVGLAVVEDMDFQSSVMVHTAVVVAVAHAHRESQEKLAMAMDTVVNERHLGAAVVLMADSTGMVDECGRTDHLLEDHTVVAALMAAGRMILRWFACAVEAGSCWIGEKVLGSVGP